MIIVWKYLWRFKMGINRSTCVCLQWILCALVFMEANAVAAAQAPLGEPASEWRLRGGNAEAQYFSSLGQINEANVRQLGLAWSADLPTPDGSSGTPVVADGVIYLSGTLNIVYAYDLRAGNLLWTFDPKVIQRPGNPILGSTYHSRRRNLERHYSA